MQAAELLVAFCVLFRPTNGTVIAEVDLSVPMAVSPIALTVL